MTMTGIGVLLPLVSLLLRLIGSPVWSELAATVDLNLHSTQSGCSGQRSHRPKTDTHWMTKTRHTSGCCWRPGSFAERFGWRWWPGWCPTPKNHQNKGALPLWWCSFKVDLSVFGRRQHMVRTMGCVHTISRDARVQFKMGWLGAYSLW